MIARDIDEREFELEHLATPRLVLRAPAMTDTAAVASLANNKVIAENLTTMPHPYKRRDAENWIKIANEIKSGKGGRFAIYSKEHDGAFIGACGWGHAHGAPIPQIGYWIGVPYWGQGYATEAAQAVIDHAFQSSDITEIGCACRVTNAGSRRVIEKCGFQYDGLGMVHSIYKGGTMPILKFRLDRGAWASIKAWGQ